MDNPHAKKVLKALKSKSPRTIRELARTQFPGVRPVTLADSRVRNALRPLVAAKAVKKIARGTYRAMPKQPWRRTHRATT